MFTELKMGMILARSHSFHAKGNLQGCRNAASTDKCKSS